MTRNQILYQEAVEKRRSNLANEIATRARDAETARSNLAREAETNRSNLANELLTANRDQETIRSHLATEAETNRSNLARELETSRANQAREAETARSNRAQERMRQSDLDEQQRSNLARELENTRAAVERERETNRANLATEELTAERIANEFVAAYDRNATQLEIAQLQAANNAAIAELREEGLNDRQAKQLLVDTLSSAASGVVKILSSSKDGKNSSAGNRTLVDYLKDQLIRRASQYD